MNFIKISMRATILFAAVTVVFPGVATAAIFQWDGGGANTSWSTAGNWVGAAPVSASANDFEFGTVALQSPSNTTANNTTAAFDLNTIIFGGTAGASFSLTGSALDLLSSSSVDSTITQNSNFAHSIANTMVVNTGSSNDVILAGNGTGVVTLSGSIDMNDRDVTKNGSSSFVVSQPLTDLHNLIVTGGTIAFDGAITNVNHELNLQGGVVGLSGTFNRNLGTSNTNNEFNWGAGGGGFAAYGGALTVDIGTVSSAQWASTASFLQNSTPLIFGSVIANNVVTYTDAIVLHTGGSSATREIRVDNNTGSTADYARITGNLSGSPTGANTASLNKTGTGLLELAGTNTYDGTTTVSAGTLLVTGTHTGGQAFAVNGGGTLGGTGSITANVNATGSGAGSKADIAPGNPYSTPGGTTLGTGVGTLSVTGNVTFGDHSRLLIDVNGATADRLTINSDLDLDNSTGEELAITAVSPTAGKYTLVSYSGSILDGGAIDAFSIVSGMPANYGIDNNTVAKTLDLRHLGTIALSASAADPVIITGGSTTISANVSNTAPVDSFDVLYGIPGFTAPNGTSVAGAVANIHTMMFNDPTLGAQSVSATANVTNTLDVTNASASQNVEITVLDHADASFDAPDAPDEDKISIVFDLLVGQMDSASYSLSNLLGDRAGLEFVSVDELGDDDDLAGSGFYQNNITGFGTLAAGGTSGLFDVFFDATSLTVGTYLTTYVINLMDEALPGALGQTLTINVTGNLTPEPASVVLLLAGGMVLGLRRRETRDK